MRGLLGSAPLGPNQALMLKTKQIHTIGMNHAIDVVYLDRRLKVLRIDEVAPGKVGPLLLRARWVLELTKGQASVLGIALGSRLNESA
ncbi:MAG: DUF192 domain-containing protein [Actinobacteria bacterium]|nr:DUF192 domain-containing protein [Actinomycetota bacterium]